MPRDFSILVILIWEEHCACNNIPLSTWVHHWLRRCVLSDSRNFLVECNEIISVYWLANFCVCSCSYLKNESFRYVCARVSIAMSLCPSITWCACAWYAFNIRFLNIYWFCWISMLAVLLSCVFFFEWPALKEPTSPFVYIQWTTVYTWIAGPQFCSDAVRSILCHHRSLITHRSRLADLNHSSAGASPW